MQEKYYLVNGYLPCICNCHKACLRKDLINRGYIITSMEEITKKQFDKQIKNLQKSNKISFNVKVLS